MSKLKYLYANGESWTFGAGVEKEERWSNLLSDKLGIIEINESKGGVSNDRMVRTTIEWFDNNTDKWDEVLVILGFIEPIRTEYWNDTFKGGKWLGWNVGQDYIQHDLLDIVGDKEWWEKYVTFFLNKTTLNYTLKNQILLLTSFFESNNIKYLMFFSWGHHLKNYKDFKTINKKYFLPEEFQNFIRDLFRVIWLKVMEKSKG